MLKRLIVYGILLGVLLGYTFIPYRSVDPQLRRYYNFYMGFVKLNCPSLKYNAPGQIIIKFSNLGEDVLGQCSLGSNRYTIEIDRKFWSKATEDEQAETMYHELTHCVLKRDHSPDRFNYMYPTTSHLYSTEVIGQVIKDIKDECESRNTK